MSALRSRAAARFSPARTGVGPDTREHHAADRLACSDAAAAGGFCLKVGQTFLSALPWMDYSGTS